MTLMESQPPPPRLKRWTKDEYYELVKRGGFEGQRVYLFRGELIEMSPQYHRHAFAVTELNTMLFQIFGAKAGYVVRIQLPFDAPGESEPEPDGLVCTREQGNRHIHPNEAVLVVEVADSSLKDDREKALEYAAAQIPEYWIVDVNNKCVEVYRQPMQDTTTALGYRYANMHHVQANEMIECIEKPGVAMPVAELFR